MKMGAIVAQVDRVQQDRIYEFGRSLGVAFQLQDDFLDAFGDPEVFGKQVGGDILSSKKTFLYISAMTKGTLEQQQALLDYFGNQNIESSEKVKQVKTLFEATGATQAIQESIKEHTQRAFAQLDKAHLSDQAKAYLSDFGKALMNRNV